jgi:hypothetical protein
VGWGYNFLEVVPKTLGYEIPKWFAVHAQLGTTDSIEPVVIISIKCDK